MIEIDGNRLDIDDLVQVARNKAGVKIAPTGIANLQRSRRQLEAILETNLPVYGINTGFGIFAKQRIPHGPQVVASVMPVDDLGDPREVQVRDALDPDRPVVDRAPLAAVVKPAPHGFGVLMPRHRINED